MLPNPGKSRRQVEGGAPGLYPPVHRAGRPSYHPVPKCPEHSAWGPAASSFQLPVLFFIPLTKLGPDALLFMK